MPNSSAILRFFRPAFMDRELRLRGVSWRMRRIGTFLSFILELLEIVPAMDAFLDAFNESIVLEGLGENVDGAQTYRTHGGRIRACPVSSTTGMRMFWLHINVREVPVRSYRACADPGQYSRCFLLSPTEFFSTEAELRNARGLHEGLEAGGSPRHHRQRQAAGFARCSFIFFSKGYSKTKHTSPDPDEIGLT